jgi:thiamine pyrophosphokinase
VRTKGLRFPLAHEDLPAGTSRGVSNEFVEPVATVDLDAGVLFAVQPERGAR